MGSFTDTKGRKLADLINADFFTSDFTDVQASNGDTLSNIAVDVRALDAGKVGNTVYQSYVTQTDAKLTNIESNLLATNTAVRGYIDTEIAALVNSAPSTLDTLDELAASLNDDANFATTVVTNLGQKLGATATVALTGDATASATAFSANAVSLTVTLADTGTATGQFGSSTQIPVITVDSKGRISAVANVNVAGVSDVIFSSANDVLDIQTADGGSFKVDMSSFTTETAAVQSGLDTQEAKQASDLANTNAYIASVSATERSALANTNARIATAEGNIATNSTQIGNQVTKQAQDLANTNARVATVEGNVTTVTNDLNTQEAKQASDLANTNARIATTEADITQAFADIQSTNTAVRSYVDTSVANLVDSAPATLDTLNELAQALGDDANFATTLTTNLGQKLGSTATVTLAGDVTGTANFSANAVTVTTDIAASGVTAGSYGSSSLIPVVTVGTDGRVTSVTTEQVSGVTGASYSASNNTVTITTADGQSYGATITDLKEISEAAAELANTNARVAVVESNVAQKLGGTASVALTGDATASGSFSANAVSLAVTLSNSGVAAGTYGSGSEVPVVTVDAKGRITSVSTTSVAGVTDFNYTGANNTFVISTADGSEFSATIDDLEEVSNALATLANTNAYIASVSSALDSQIASQTSAQSTNESRLDTLELDLDTQEAKQAADLANTNARVATAEGNITTVDLKVDALRSDHNTTFGQVNATATAIRSDFNTLIGSVNTAISTVDGKVDTLRSDHNSTLQSVNTTIATLRSDHNSTFTNVNNTINTQTSRIDLLNTNLLATNTAVRGYVDAEVAALVDSAPAALDTLNELAAALGDDANFATTLSTNLGQKLGGTASVTLNGDVTGTANFSANAMTLTTDIVATGTPTGTFGSSSKVAQITVGADGRITNIANVGVAGVTSFGYTNANNTLVITTADGGSFEAQIEDFELASDAASKFASVGTTIGNVNTTVSAVRSDFNTLIGSVNSAISAVATDLDTQEAKQASDLANTNARVATVEGNVTTVTNDLNTQEAKQASDLANTNAYIASVATDLDTQEAKQASDLANTNARVATVEGDLATQIASERSALANTNTRIATSESKVAQVEANLLATNTAIRGYVDSEVAALVDSAPAALDTLNELAAALGDDANFATTLSTNLGQKLGGTASVTLSGDVTGTANFSANAVTVTTDISATGTQTGVFGSSTLVPVITVGADGRITNVANVAVGGVDTLVFHSANDALSISTTAGDTITVDLSSFTVETAQVQTNLDTQEAKQASDLANTNAYIASVDTTRNANLANTNAQITAVDGKVDTLRSDHNTTMGQINATATAIRSDFNTLIGSVNTAISTVDTKVDTLRSDHNTTFTNVNNTVTAVRSDFNALIGSVNTAISTVDTKVDTLRSDTNILIGAVNTAISTEQSRIDLLNTNLVATNTAIRGYVDTEVAALVDAAPAALDTLNELAAALGDDANFATTLSTNLGQKLGGTASVALTGDATASGSFSANALSMAVTLADTGTQTGVFGSATSIPQITVDSKGRVTNIANVSVAGVSSFGYTNANNTLVITTADGGSFEAQIEDFELASDAASKFSSVSTTIGNVNTAVSAVRSDFNTLIGSVNSAISAVATDLDTQEAKQASDLANTNARVATVEGDLATQIASERSALANTNAYIASVDTTRNANLANTNAYIASVATDLDTQEAKQASDLANTNARVATVEGDVTTQTSRIDLLNTNLLATNTAVRGYVDTSVAALVDSAPATLDTLNELAAALGDDANFATTLSTNLGQKLGSTATVTLSGDVIGTASFSANAVTITTVDTNLGNTNAYIASVQSALDTQEAKQASDLANTNAYILTVDTRVGTQESKQASDLANTNAYILSVDTVRNSNLANTNAKLLNIESNLLATNTAIRALIPDTIAYDSFVYTATANQVAFSGADDNGTTLVYDTTAVEVYLNGVLLVGGVDYVTTDSTTITLDDACQADDIVSIHTHNVANYVTAVGTVDPVSGTATAVSGGAVLDTFGTGAYRTVKYLVQATDSVNNEYESMEVMVLHNGSTVLMNEYSSLQTSGSLVTLDADIFGGNVRLKGETASGSITVKAIRLAVAV